MRLSSVIAGLSAAAVAFQGVAYAVQGPAKSLLRPPGAQGEADFSARCIKCGKCMEACPYLALSPAPGDQGIAAGTPMVDARAPVSYTHLDVYKRQVHDDGERRELITHQYDAQHEQEDPRVRGQVHHGHDGPADLHGRVVLGVLAGMPQMCIRDSAKGDLQTIVLPEGDDERTLQAAERILAEGVANLVILGLSLIHI